MKKNKKIDNYIYIFLLIFGISFFLSSFESEQTFCAEPNQISKIVGNSMLLEDGTVVYGIDVDFSEIKIGDIIRFKANGIEIKENGITYKVSSKDNLFIMHRVVYKGEDYIITQGDNLENFDTYENVPKENIDKIITIIE